VTGSACTGDSSGIHRSWGAEYRGNGEVRFRVWAPGAPTLGLRLTSADMTMQPCADGWYELTVPDVAPGADYSFVLPDGTCLPDPAARAQAGDVHGPSRVVDPSSYSWSDSAWHGRPWREAVVYELHIGTFTPEGTFSAAAEKLDHLAALGVTAIEIMPLAQFSGKRGWGYDGVLLYAPHAAYGTPDDLKELVDRAHGLGIMVLLDVVYNHFGPDGNYLPTLAPDFFHQDRHTPWGAAIAYDREPVRQFFVENALYWLADFHLDGLRFDAVDQIRDPDSQTEILVEIAQRIRAAFPNRHIHLTTEDNRNITRLHEGRAGEDLLFTAEWNDDFHNAAHVVATGETDGYYHDFADEPLAHMATALAEGFVFQGQASADAGEPRGEPSGHLPPDAFVDFLQNHDQVGNRALGERLTALSDPEIYRLLRAMLLLSPHIPLLFMGEEWGETRRFLFFTDFHGELADAVRRGRRREFAKFAAFDTPEERLQIPDPNDPATFEASKIDWTTASGAAGREWLDDMRHLLTLRRDHITPLLDKAGGNCGRIVEVGDGLLAVDWSLGGATLQLRLNLAREERALPACRGDTLFALPDEAAASLSQGRLPGPAIVVALAREAGSDAA